MPFQNLDGKDMISLVFVFIILLYVWNTTKEKLHDVVRSFYQTREVKDNGEENESDENDKNNNNKDDEDDFPDENVNENQFNTLGADSNTSIFLFDAISWEGSLIMYRVAIMAILFLFGLGLFNIMVAFFSKVKADDTSIEENTREQYKKAKKITEFISSQEIYKMVYTFTCDFLIAVLWMFLSTVFATLYVYFIVPNGEHEKGINDEEATHMHIDIMMFFLLFLMFALLYYAAMIRKE